MARSNSTSGHRSVYSLQSFLRSMDSRYGSPETLTADQGNQFELRLFTALLQPVGCHKIHTTAYHPASNGMVERWHRTLKAAIICHSNLEWSRSLSTVLLGLRSNVLEVGASPAEFVFGTVLRIPGEFFLSEDCAPNPQFFLEEFGEYMRAVKPIPVEHKHKRKAFVFKDLKSCTHVFLRDFARKSLERPYTGPHKIINRTSDRMFEIDFNGTPKQVSIENIKPAHFVRDDVEHFALTDSNSSCPITAVLLASNVAPTLRTYQRKKNVTFDV